VRAMLSAAELEGLELGPKRNRDQCSLKANCGPQLGKMRDGQGSAAAMAAAVLGTKFGSVGSVDSTHPAVRTHAKTARGQRRRRHRQRRGRDHAHQREHQQHSCGQLMHRRRRPHASETSNDLTSIGQKREEGKSGITAGVGGSLTRLRLCACERACASPYFRGGITPLQCCHG
jgi:hypothetical protein